jgi:hypothetical protein
MSVRILKRSWPIMDGNKAQHTSLASLSHYIPAPSNNWRRLTLLQIMLRSSNWRNPQGSPYRTTIGELMNAFVACCLDIDYAMEEFSKFSCGPAACHFAAAKRVFRYLCQTKDEGLVYWRPKTRLDLPHVPLKYRTVDEVDLKLTYTNWLFTSMQHTRIVPRLACRWGLMYFAWLELRFTIEQSGSL